MAAPSTKTRKATPAKRKFTLAEANRALPLVSRIVRDIVNAHERATELQTKLEEALPAKLVAAAQEQLDSTLDRLQDYVDELDVLGIELKDYEAGLIDFRGRHQGRDVYLCWKLGEEKVSHWHEIQAGFSGRQPASKLEE